ncbi:MAG: hypothetical protein R3F22_01295 [Lysobacteraceae bacterium]
MNFKSLKIGAAIAGALMISSVSAGQLVVTNGAAKKGAQSMALDFATDGNATALQFEISLPKGVSADQVDLSACTADLPKTHGGACNVAKGKIIGLVFSDSNELLPAGVVSIGRISFRGSNAKVGAMQVTKFLVSDANANQLEAKVMVDGAASDGPMKAPVRTNRKVDPASEF